MKNRPKDYPMKPVHKHDCDKCEYVCTIFDRYKTYDYYVCGDTVLARYGDEGDMYWSSPIDCVSEYPAWSLSEKTWMYSAMNVLALKVWQMYKKRKRGKDGKKA